MRILQLSSPSSTPAPRSTGCTTILLTPKSVPTVGWIRVVLCQRVDFELPLTLYFVQSWRSFAHITTQALNSLPTWTTGTCGSNRSAYYRQSLLSQAATKSVNLALQSTKTQCGKALARTFHLSFKTRSHSHSAAWEDTSRSTETLSPGLLLWESRPPWRKQHNAFRELQPHLQTLTPKDSMRRQ